ncbi:MAG: M3 family oligoendopeptidase [Candidatus Woesearchaeota archaeon]
MKENWDFKELEVDEKKTLKEVEDNTNLIASYKNKQISVSELKKILDLKQEIKSGFGKLYAYYSLKQSLNTEDTKALSKLGLFQDISNDISNKTRFVSIWFSRLSKEEAKKYYESKELEEYKYHLKNLIKNKKYILDEDKEEIISIKNISGADAIVDIYDILTSRYEYDWEGEIVTQEHVTSFFNNSDPKKREKAYQLVLGKYKEESVLLSEIYKNIVKDWYNEAIKIRKYKSSISVRNVSNDVSDKSVEVLLKVCEKNVKVFSEYFKLKHELNKGKYENSRYHIYAPLDIKQKKYSYEESKKIVLDTFEEFDKRMYDAALRIFDKGHVDSHPYKNKRGGAFCYSPTSKVTPYILLNHTDNLKDVFTMIHELGHGLHSLAASKHNEYNFHANLPLAETASIFSENLLANKMLRETKKDEEKIDILREIIDSSYASIGRQSFFVLFELKAHEAVMRGATKEEIDEIYYDILKKQFGDMPIPDEYKHEWNYIPHIHRSPFYCYAYAWGNLLVLSLYAMYEKEGESFKDKYWNILSAGGSKNPQELLLEAGIDVEKEEFWQQGFDIIKRRIKEFKGLVKS